MAQNGGLQFVAVKAPGALGDAALHLCDMGNGQCVLTMDGTDFMIIPRPGKTEGLEFVPVAMPGAFPGNTMRVCDLGNGNGLFTVDGFKVVHGRLPGLPSPPFQGVWSASVEREREPQPVPVSRKLDERLAGVADAVRSLQEGQQSAAEALPQLVAIADTLPDLEKRLTGIVAAMETLQKEAAASYGVVHQALTALGARMDRELPLIGETAAAVVDRELGAPTAGDEPEPKAKPKGRKS